MSSYPPTVSLSRPEIAALLFMAIALPSVIKLYLLPALFAGLLVHELVHLLAPRLFGADHQGRAKIVVLALMLTLIILVIGGAIVATVLFLRSDAGSLSVLLEKMAEILDKARETLPASLREWIPIDASDLKDQLVAWLREHAKEVKTISGEVGHGLVYALIGMVIGALVSLRQAHSGQTRGPLARALSQCILRLAQAFRRVVFAQVRISAMNTVLTAIYLVVVLPLFGVHLPLTKTMILITFLAGLLPVLGNLISNAIVVVISLSYSMPAAMGSLAFLVIIHKLEYFVNARIVGSQIDASAWELLLAMVVMEAAFGLAGVIAAPVFYAYLKSELSERGWV
ncbi:MAG TPA: AI-2E family transporter [Burkholderiales bacterium]|nr:AI-2E family transporter [Burkholderiales bacterium]